ncbi:LOW QUALITY PROTEIN: ricin B-like lectin EULS3 [Cajanus cajan]|uniref:LOW QUALITY PROTEIN: ricin B-like lectin EULS3 n=1 Tax=Cajanus cajan TaxID=3821 RepID=UPI00098D93B8|nr:LOW QUALITY PROTEIN: ricin B-like lectin EULS3 [Cajanus cajan]
MWQAGLLMSNPAGDALTSMIGVIGNFSNKPSVRVVSKAAGPQLSLSIRHGKVILASLDPSDAYQHWFKDERYSTRRDEAGFCAFSLVNKATGEALKHPVADYHTVRMMPYNPDILDESVLWSEGEDLGDGYSAIRMVNNIRFNMDACCGDKESGGTHDGTTIILWDWNHGDNQQWKILPYCKLSTKFFLFEMHAF